MRILYGLIPHMTLASLSVTFEESLKPYFSKQSSKAYIMATPVYVAVPKNGKPVLRNCICLIACLNNERLPQG